MVTALFVIGVAAEFVGILCLAVPDLVPWRACLSGWLRRAENRVRRILRLPQRPVVHTAEAGAYGITGFSASGIISPGPQITTIEEKVEYLLRRDQAAQDALNALGDRVDHLEAESPRQLARTEQEMKEHVARERAAAREEYRPLRLAGAILLAVGLGCVTFATLLA